jgi:large subunit ribosomal protein L29
MIKNKKAMQALREESVSALHGQLEADFQESFRCRMKHKTGALGNTAELARIRKRIARVKTVLQEKKQAGDQ